MVKIRYWQKICRVRETWGTPCSQFDVNKHKLPDIADRFRSLQDDLLKLRAEEWKRQCIENKWTMLKEDTEIMEDVLGLKERFRRAHWFDEECRTTIKERNNARLRMYNEGQELLFRYLRIKEETI